MRSLQVNGIKDFSISSDNKLASFTLVTKYAGDLGISVPVQSLEVLQSAFKPELIKPAAPAPESPPPTKQGELTVALAKKWLVAADKKQGVALVVSNPGDRFQAGFALKAKEARDLAAALLKQAAALEAAGPPQT